MTTPPDDRLRELAISDTGFVFDPYSGATFTVNPSGLVILEALRRRADRDAILDLLHERFDVHGEDLERDLDEFLHLLRHHGLIAEEGAS
ncbi:MAG: HPr-rel-A system PqqD family peptide chaperone [Myxococcales bacterium]|nr:HPr-rel-A system PqqD family peptide chaperone [Myxococcales bacterium]MCB9701974.1 HPr-rel-A system PqqD family peptide chaperone [Myxococcales bacterium]